MHYLLILTCIYETSLSTAKDRILARGFSASTRYAPSIGVSRSNCHLMRTEASRVPFCDGGTIPLWKYMVSMRNRTPECCLLDTCRANVGQFHDTEAMADVGLPRWQQRAFSRHHVDRKVMHERIDRWSRASSRLGLH